MAEENAIELRAMMARWEALRERWALDAREEAGLLGGTALKGRVGDATSWSAAALERRMRLLVELGQALDTLLQTDQRICLWLRRPLDSMGGRSPIEVMSSSDEWIRQIRGAALDFAP